MQLTRLSKKTLQRIVIFTVIILLVFALVILFKPPPVVVTATPSGTPIPESTSAPTVTPQPTVRAINFYVSPTGNNEHAGSLEYPWQTIQHAVDQALPGDTIHLRTGIYNENVFITRSGKENAPITLTSYLSDKVEVNGGTDSAIRASGAVAYWTIKNLTIMSSSRYTLTIGWWDDGITDHWIIQNNSITGANFLRGTNHIWEDNDINGFGYTESFGDAGISEGGESHHNIYRRNTIHDFTNKDARGIWSQGNTHDSIFEYNTITNIFPDGDGIKGQCIDLDGAGNVEWRHIIRGNRLSNCNYVGIQLENVFDSIVENNFINNSKAAGIIVISYDSDIGCRVGGENSQYGDAVDCRGKLLENEIRQNIIVNSGDVGGIVSYGSAGVKVYNNLVYGSSVGIFFENTAEFSHSWDVSGNIFSNNNIAEFSLVDPASLSNDANNLLYSEINNPPYFIRGNPQKRYSLAEWQNVFNLGQGSVEGDPGFINPEVFNFHLRPGSPAIDNGLDTGLVLDFDGKARLSGGNFDIGPFELTQ